MNGETFMLQLLQRYSTKDRLYTAIGLCLMLVGLLGVIPDAVAHAVTAGDKGYIQETTGIHAIPFIYLGAKHMMTGYDHLLFLLGVIFFLYRLQHILIYVSLFAVGHVITLLTGVLMEISINAFVIDAIIGFSIVYKSLDNMGAFQRWFGVQPNTKIATLLFGLLHGFGLATKILEYELSSDGLVPNLIFFNIGVEIGQILALIVVLIAVNFWRKSGHFMQHAYSANVFIMMLGFLLMGFHITGFFV
ncbi:MAG: hypothetical protein ACI8VC_000747 [Candidatus Endobugula sp.]|jgi:hypothetical protein